MKRLVGILLMVTVLLSCRHQPTYTGKTLYHQVKNWPVLPDTMQLGNPAGIGIDTSQNVFVFRRGSRDWPLLGAMPKTPIKQTAILLLDASTGKIINSWGGGLFIMPHGLTVDSANNVWVTDVGLHQVFKFSHNGNLLLKIGVAGVPANDARHFNQPTDVSIAADGSFYVSDGYGNSRIVKFSAQGKYLLSWGTKGSDAGHFNTPHGLALNNKGNVYVADRENKRIQVFDPTGKFLKQINDDSFGRICAIAFDQTRKQLIAVDDDTSWFNLKHDGSNVIILDMDGHITSRFGRNADSKCWYHDIAVDRQGNIYTADILGNKVQKFTRR